MKFFYLLACCLWAFASALPAQTPPAERRHRCGTDIIVDKLLREHPHLWKLRERTDHAIFEYLSAPDGKHPFAMNGEETHTIPVVVHIVHNGGPENISDSQVFEGIRHINEAFSNLQLDGTATISFALCIARQDETGRPTTGITRTTSELTDVAVESQDPALKDLVRWNTAQYLNIWVVRSITSSSGSGVAGYATLPFSHGATGDGIVVEAGYFGTSPVYSAVAIHEVGHYLGLYHTFEGGCGNNNCLLDGDRVCDTPPDASTAYTDCDRPMNTCLTDEDDRSANNPFRPVADGGTGDRSDMISNFMDYSEFACQRAFTAGQARRMAAALVETRSSLLSSQGCLPACTTPIAVSFSIDRPAVYTGEPVNFTGTATGATSYQWRVDGIGFASTKDASYTFSEPGLYVISLEASNGGISCTRSVYDTIAVQCSAAARFTADNTLVDPNTEVHFTNTGTGATAYAWYVDGQPRSTDRDYSEIFAGYGSHTIMLIASNSLCADTAYAFVTVRSCSAAYDNIWYFGNRLGVDFSTEPPTVLDDGAMNSYEGCATICNSDGQLLFYTNGETVWDRLHRIMPGGDGTLGGHQSATQGAIIVPHPGNPLLYYIFTVDAGENQFKNGLSYAVVDMALNNGAGEVVDVATALHPSAGESVVGVAHSNGRDFWVVVLNWSDPFAPGVFSSFLVSDKGVSSTPVASTAGAAGGSHVLKLSPSGTLLAVGNLGGLAGLYPFDASAGTVGSTGILRLPDTQERVLGMEFSPDERFLYISSVRRQSGAPAVSQYDLAAGDPAAIAASAVRFDDIRQTGSLQLAPNGKIYVARLQGREPGVINAPNKKGAECDYRRKGLALLNNSQNSNLGLPNFIRRRTLPVSTDIAGPTALCIPATASYTLADGSFDPLQWTHRGNNTLTVSDGNPTVHLHISSAGIDTLIALYSNGCAVGEDTLFITSDTPPLVSLGPDTALCDNRPIVLDAGPGFASYRWQDGSAARTFEASAPGTYTVTVATDGGCTVSDTVVVYRPEVPALDLGRDTATCAGNIIVLDAGPGFRRYRWQDNSGGQRLTVYRAGTYSVEAEMHCGAVVRDTIVVQHTQDAVQVLGDTTLCAGGSARLTALADAASFVWSPQEGLDNPTSPTPIASPTVTTTYTVHAILKNGCVISGRATVEVRGREVPVVLRLPDTTASPGELLRLPVYLDVSPDILPLHIPVLRFAVRYRAALLQTTAVANGTYSSARDGDYETTTVELRDLALNNNSSLVAELTGRVFVGDSTSTALVVADAFADECTMPVGMSGRLALLDGCILPLRRIRLRDATAAVLDITPNPAGDAATAQIAVTDEGMHTIAVYNLQGQLVWNSHFTHSGDRSAHAISIQLRGIPAGLYQVVLTTPSQAVTSILSVVK